MESAGLPLPKKFENRDQKDSFGFVYHSLKANYDHSEDLKAHEKV